MTTEYREGFVDGWGSGFFAATGEKPWSVVHLERAEKDWQRVSAKRRPVSVANAVVSDLTRKGHEDALREIRFIATHPLQPGETAEARLLAISGEVDARLRAASSGGTTPSEERESLRTRVFMHDAELASPGAPGEMTRERKLLVEVAETQMALAVHDADLGRMDERTPEWESEREDLEEEAERAIGSVLAWWDKQREAAKLAASPAGGAPSEEPDAELRAEAAAYVPSEETWRLP